MGELGKFVEPVVDMALVSADTPELRLEAVKTVGVLVVEPAGEAADIAPERVWAGIGASAGARTAGQGVNIVGWEAKIVARASALDIEERRALGTAEHGTWGPE